MHPIRLLAVKSRDIQIFLRFYAASLVRLNAQNHHPIFFANLKGHRKK